MHYSNGKDVKMIRPAIRSQNAGIVEIKQGPMLGEHTAELMKECGLSDAEIQSMIENGSVKQHA
jgi:crotonobetainyl-CoA:carnitine CoA-transferase CaiB-like acyl-CoA transferase